MDPITFLRLYVNPSWRRKGLHSPLLYPFWGNPNSESSLFAKEIFDSYSFDTSLYEVTEDISQADMVFAPYRQNWLLRHDEALLKECADTAHKAGLPLLIDGIGDVEYPNTIENSFILRIGGYRFIPEKNRIQLPAVADDLLERCEEGRLTLREKRAGERPVIGFAGWSSLSMWQGLRTVIKELPMRLRGMVDPRWHALTKGVVWRSRALAALKRSPLVKLNLKERTSFSGSAKTASGDLRQLRRDFVDTLLQSDYGLDVRGDANDSTRLGEILSLGRIPLIVDTERRLAYADILDYDSFSVRVDFRDLADLPRRIAEFHAKITPQRFIEMQQNARRVFAEHFRVDAHMKHVLRQINEIRASLPQR